MSFPTNLNSIHIDLFLNGAWQDVSALVLHRDGMQISRGRSNEASQSDPAACSMTLDNTDGRFSPRNPLGIYYSSLRRNTPVRVGVDAFKETFSRTVVNGWGSTDAPDSYAYTLSGTAADFDVTPGAATVNVPAATDIRLAYLSSTNYADVDVSTTFEISQFPNGNGPSAESVLPGGLVVRGISTADYYYLRLSVDNDNNNLWTMSVRHLGGAGETSGTVYTNVTAPFPYVAGRVYGARLQAEGNNIRGKFWLVSSGEPYDWNVTLRGVTRRTGWVGIRTASATLALNPNYVTTYGTYAIRRMRFAGEVANWPPRWDVSGNDAHTPIECAGILQRLNQGQPPLHSAIYRGIMSMGLGALSTQLRAYWPCEDLKDSTSIASAFPSSEPMSVEFASSEFASFSDFDCSAPIPKLNLAGWFGNVPAYTVPATPTAQLRMIINVPAAGATDDTIIARLGMSGTATLWELIYRTAGAGAFQVKAYDIRGTNILTSGVSNAGLNGKLMRISLELKQNGANVDYNVVWLEVGSPVGGQQTVFSLASRAIGQVFQVQVGPQGLLDDVAVGHVTFQSAITPLFDLYPEFNAYVPERAGRRMERLCGEEGIPFYYSGSLDETPFMGPQRIATLLELIRSCEDVDMGTLHEPRGTIGLQYRTRRGAYNQSEVASLSLSGGQVAPPFEPTEDDSYTRNKVTATRDNGSSYTVEITTGPMSTADPEDGGVGEYSTEITLNVQSDADLPAMAGWLAASGTVDEYRYPHIDADWGNSNVAASQTLIDALYDLDIDDLIEVTGTSAKNIYDDVRQLVRGYSEFLNSDQHTISTNTSPASLYDVVVMNDTFSKWDSEVSSLTDAINSSSTSFRVTSMGAQWTTVAGQFPFDIMVDGERMTVTNISGIPSYISTGVAAHGNNASVVPALAASGGANDVLLCYAAIRNSGAGFPNTPAGYTLLVNMGNARLFGKIHSGSESAPTVSFNGGVANATTSAQMGLARGCILTPLAPAVTQLNSSAQDIAYPGIAFPPGGNALVIALGWKQDDWTSVAALTGMFEIAEFTSTLGDDQGMVWNQVPYSPLVTLTFSPLQENGSFLVTGGVSAISSSGIIGLAGPQTFTVTRAINGVVRSHAAGASVKLARRATLGL